MARIGLDIGGTFTDFVLLDEATGAFSVEKVLTTAADPSIAVDDGVGKLLARHSFTSHNLGKKSAKRKLHLGRPVVVAKPDQKRVERLLHK